MTGLFSETHSQAFPLDLTVDRRYPLAKQSINLVQRSSQSDGTEPQIPALSLEELERTESQTLLTQHILVLV